MMLDEYAYSLPKELIGQRPAEPRDSARLFVYDTKTDTITFDIFQNLAQYIPDSLIVRNDTRVLPVRLLVRTGQGKEMELFVLTNDGMNAAGQLYTLVRGKVTRGDVLSVGPYQFRIDEPHDTRILVTPLFAREMLEDILFTYGTTPIPPYIHDHGLSEDALRKRYQTVFAQNGASVAAPTASLHFTKNVLTSLTNAGASFVDVTLHVGMGTFAPVTEDQLKNGQLHGETYAVTRDAACALMDARVAGRPIVAVGTTVVRTLESARGSIVARKRAQGRTQLFIQPPHTFVFPDSLITNFHVPRSSLMCLVDAFLEHKRSNQRILDLYARAIEERFRFFSFGDVMLIR